MSKRKPTGYKFKPGKKGAPGKWRFKGRFSGPPPGWDRFGRFTGAPPSPPPPPRQPQFEELGPDWSYTAPTAGRWRFKGRFSAPPPGYDRFGNKIDQPEIEPPIGVLEDSELGLEPPAPPPPAPPPPAPTPTPIRVDGPEDVIGLFELRTEIRKRLREVKAQLAIVNREIDDLDAKLTYLQRGATWKQEAELSEAARSALYFRGRIGYLELIENLIDIRIGLAGSGLPPLEVSASSQDALGGSDWKFLAGASTSKQVRWADLAYGELEDVWAVKFERGEAIDAMVISDDSYEAGEDEIHSPSPNFEIQVWDDGWMENLTGLGEGQ